MIKLYPFATINTWVCMYLCMLGLTGTAASGCMYVCTYLDTWVAIGLSCRYSVLCFEPANVCLNGWSTIYYSEVHNKFSFVFACMKRNIWELEILDTTICSVWPLILIWTVKYYKICKCWELPIQSKSVDVREITFQDLTDSKYNGGLMILWSWAHEI